MQFPDRHGPPGPDGSSVDRGQGPGTSGGFGAPESYLPAPPSQVDTSRVNETLDALLALGADLPRAGGSSGDSAEANVPDWLAREAGQEGPKSQPVAPWSSQPAEPGTGWAPAASSPPPPPPPVQVATSDPEPAGRLPAPPHAQPSPELAGGEVIADDEMQDVPLGTLIYRAGLLGAADLEQALEESVTAGKRLGEVLLDRGLIEERDLGRLLAGQKGLQFVELGSIEIDPAAAELLPASSARVYGALPIRLEQGVPIVAVSDPTNGIVVEGVRRALGDPLLVVAARSDLQEAIGRFYAVEPGDPADERISDPAGVGSHVPPAPAVPVLGPDLAARIPSHEPVAEPAGPPASVLAPVRPTVEPPPRHQLEEALPPVADTTEAVRVSVSLANGERVDVGVFAEPDEAIERARALARSIDSHEPGEWPLLGTRLVRPDTITAIELLEEKPRY